MTKEEVRQNYIIREYLDKYFRADAITELIEKFTFSEIRRLLGELDIEFFALCYFPKYFDREFGDFHKELFLELKYMLAHSGLIEAFGLPREHGKSTINSFLFPLYSTLYRKSQFTLIISATEQIALPFLDMIKDELENNPLLIEDFQIRKGNRWNNNEIWIRGANGIDACIMIRGIDGSLRGIHFKQYRPQLVLLDDLLKDDTAKSETKREQVKNTFTDVVIPIGTKDTNILVVGTVLHEEDLMADLLKGKIPGVRSIRKSAIISFSSREDLWGTWEQLYNNLQDGDRIQTAKNYYEEHIKDMLEDTQILWKEYLDYYYLMCKKQSMGDKSFYKELQNDPRSTDEYIFQNILYYEQLPSTAELEVVMYIDPAIKAGKKNDYSAVTILGKHRVTGQMYIIEGTLYKLLPDDLFVEVVKKFSYYNIDKIGFEATQAQSYMKQKFEETLWNHQIYVPVEEIHSKGQKHERIITLEPDIKRGYILFNRNNTAYVELKQAFIRLYNNMVKDKGSFFRTFYANVEKVMNKKTTAPDIDKLTKQINVYQSDLSELIQLKLRHQIDDSYYNTEYLRITGELESLQEQKKSLRDISLDNAKMKEKIAVIKETIGGDTQPLEEFDDELFKILVDRVLIRDAKHVTFIFESGLEFDAELYAEEK